MESLGSAPPGFVDIWTRDQIVNIRSIIEKARGFQKNIYFCFIDYTKAFDCGSQQSVENSSSSFSKEVGIPDHLTCLLRNLYAGQEPLLELDMDNRLVPNWERSTSSLYIVTLLI